MRLKALFAGVLLAVVLLACGCAYAENMEQAYTDAVRLDMDGLNDEEAVITRGEAALPELLQATAPGELVQENAKAIIDYSNTEDGYVMVLYREQTKKTLKVQIKGPKTTYTYTIQPGEWATLSLSEGNGNYQVKMYQNVSGKSYSNVLSAKMSVELADEFAPFLRPNQYVNYSASSKAVALARELTAGIEHPLGKVEAIYNYVVKTLSYDKKKAKSVKSGYTPVLDAVLEEKKGICFDYVALMTGMLRSLGIPCKMIFGYAGGAYHAWISVWSEDTGWVDGVIFFDGTTWQRLDPTFASSANQSDAIMQYIGNGKNYKEKYFY